ncbi:MAG: metal ABC transporter substrate-binding protein [Myxococcota bacterium]
MTDRFTKLLVAASIAIGLFVTPDNAAAKVEIVATLGDLGSAAEHIAGEHGSVTVLAAPQQDPHFVDAKPSFVAKLSKADILVYNGMSLETGWLPTLISGSRNPAIQSGEPGDFNASEYVVKRGVPDVKIDRSMGDVHAEGNPHFTYDPRQMARVGLALGKRLAKIDSEHADYYKSRARDFAKDCIRLAQKWELAFGKLEGHQHNIVVYHEAWVYVENWLKLEPVATVEPKPGVPPNPKHVAKVMGKIRDNDARAILQMEYYPDSATKVLAKKTKAQLIRVQGHTREGESYLDRVDRLAESIYKAVTGD